MTTREATVAIVMMVTAIVFAIIALTAPEPSTDSVPEPEIGTALYCERVGWDVAGEPIVECIESP